MSPHGRSDLIVSLPCLGSFIIQVYNVYFTGNQPAGGDRNTSFSTVRVQAIVRPRRLTLDSGGWWKPLTCKAQQLQPARTPEHVRADHRSRYPRDAKYSTRYSSSRGTYQQHKATCSKGIEPRWSQNPPERSVPFHQPSLHVPPEHNLFAKAHREVEDELLDKDRDA